jgi:hypothetical protein
MILPTVSVSVCVFVWIGRTTHSQPAGKSTVPYNFYCSQPIHSPVHWTSREKNICVLYQYNIVCLPCQQFSVVQFIVITPRRNCREALPEAHRLSCNFKQASQSIDYWFYAGITKFICWIEGPTRCTCIYMYSLFLSIFSSTWFGCYLHPSSGTQTAAYSHRYV